MDEGSGRKSAGLMDMFGRFLTGKKRITEEEIQDIIDASEEEGLINPEENEMIRSIFELRDTVVREIMVPRTDMACVSADTSVGEVLRTIITCGHSRIPVYDGTVDNIIGLIYAKDLLKYWGMGDSSINIRRIMRTPYFIPESKNLEELLQEFKRKRVHIAIVIDEYGGTSGLVTIEDLLEQIVGDIQDEYDLEEDWIVEEPDGSVLVDARLPIEDLEERFGIEIEREKFDTVAGLIFHLTGRIPKVGEEIENDALRMTVLEGGERNIRKVRVARRAGASEETEG
ncbi:CBS domain containing protein [Geobacter metallireducens RCH3]|uniref:CBS and CorC_HlyC domain protein n=1 Tax=Geobacter metallireducens (strain ATCC 53774 / DSM 7210 / GS-15) TaxID=269799 RepID=Q39T31_GEOMG|nr:hemolysin family protein [Geobacter metallireducens]ABB32593.1 CBS and CorC_HlyC domain protein [Geobacter metallireducens GS-15]EHP86380.1 CBS domain containing protein [Geobacter metallireducens RCH3]